MEHAMQFDLVAPERRLASFPASEVRIPGSTGDLAAMPGHAPLVITLRPGILKARGAEGEQEYLVTGGFAEISGTACTVLAEHSFPVDEVDQEVFGRLVAEARARQEAAREAGDHGLVDDLMKIVADMVALGTHIGLDPNQANYPG